MGKIKTLIKMALGTFGFEIRRIHESSEEEPPKYSLFDEQLLIERYVAELHLHDECVDIGASDGIGMSNTYALFKRGWKGLAVECDSEKFSNLAGSYRGFPSVRLSKGRITPQTAVALLQSNEIPRSFDFLSLDIDSYDYFVLEQLLTEFRPRLICAEINEKVPPPVKFTVLWNPDHFWNGDHFYGQSISQLYQLCGRFKYSLVGLEYNNAFLVADESNIYPTLTAEDAYRSGYRDRTDRKEKMPWNSNVEELLNMEPEQAVQFLNTFFRKYEGLFTCSL